LWTGLGFYWKFDVGAARSAAPTPNFIAGFGNTLICWGDISYDFCFNPIPNLVFDTTMQLI
jgi:hypothetical protein